MMCSCGEVELGVATGVAYPTAELGGVLHRTPEPCYVLEHGEPIPGQVEELELIDPADIGREIIRILELGYHTRKIELEADGPTILAKVTTTGYLDETNGREFLELIKHYRLVPVEPLELEPFEAEDATVPVVQAEWSGAVTEDATETDLRPHSRACGIQKHEHGSACSSNCPTCHGSDERAELVDDFR